VYYIFLVSFLGFPVLALLFSIRLKINWNSELVKLITGFFLLHNLLFFLGWSLKGDYVDYYIFSIEYFFFCLAIFVLVKSKNVNTLVRIVRGLGLALISLDFIFGLFGILFFIFISMGYEADQIFHFESNNKNYETRRYGFGGVTLSDTKYTFETYREFKYLPIEHQIDKTIFFENKAPLSISEPQLIISIVEGKKAEQIIFKDSEGKTFFKSIN